MVSGEGEMVRVVKVRGGESESGEGESESSESGEW